MLVIDSDSPPRTREAKYKSLLMTNEYFHTFSRFCLDCFHSLLSLHFSLSQVFIRSSLICSHVQMQDDELFDQIEFHLLSTLLQFCILASKRRETNNNNEKQSDQELCQ